MKRVKPAECAQLCGAGPAASRLDLSLSLSAKSTSYRRTKPLSAFISGNSPSQVPFVEVSPYAQSQRIADNTAETLNPRWAPSASGVQLPRDDCRRRAGEAACKLTACAL